MDKENQMENNIRDGLDVRRSSSHLSSELVMGISLYLMVSLIYDRMMKQW